MAAGLFTGIDYHQIGKIAPEIVPFITM